jgi:alkylation response protein AidB-like acyl-CoA dehydrogenase
MREFDDLLDTARRNGRIDDPIVRQRLSSMWSRLEIQRWNSLRMLTMADRPELSGPAYVSKLYWARLHRELGELAVDVLGAGADVCDAHPYELSPAQRLFLYTRADTIYGGSNQIQRNIIGERALGLPPEPKVVG